MTKARTLLFSSAIHRYPFSIISPKESPTANKQIPDAAGPGFPELAWVGHISATSKCLSFFPSPPQAEDWVEAGAGTVALVWSEGFPG